MLILANSFVVARSRDCFCMFRGGLALGIICYGDTDFRGYFV